MNPPDAFEHWKTPYAQETAFYSKLGWYWPSVGACKVHKLRRTGYLVEYLQRYSLIYPTRHGFVRKLSYLSNHLALKEWLTTRMVGWKDVGVIYHDLSEALDSTNWHLLRHNLQGYGVNLRPISRIRCFLIGHAHRVKVIASVSSSVTAPLSDGPSD